MKPSLISKLLCELIVLVSKPITSKPLPETLPNLDVIAFVRNTLTVNPAHGFLPAVHVAFRNVETPEHSHLCSGTRCESWYICRKITF